MTTASGGKLLLTVNPNNCTLDAVTTQSWAISLDKNYMVSSFKLNTTAGSPASPGAAVLTNIYFISVHAGLC